MKKRLFALPLIVLALILALAACGRSAEENKKPSEPKGNDGKVTVLLDAGHGFGDIGCKYDFLGGLSESDLTLTYVSLIKNELENLGYTVLLTHDGISFPLFSELCALAEEKGVDFDPEKMKDNNVFDAYERTVYANILAKDTEIDFMLSIHVNANADSDKCEGFEIDYCAENASSDVTKIIFSSVCDSLEKEFEGRKLKKFADSWDDSFIVTKYVSMPSVLLETGFASTESEAELLTDALWQSRLASAVARGIKNYFEN